MKTGRNEPCPCGSGKKYKKCCGMYPASKPGSEFSVDDTDSEFELERMFGRTATGEDVCMVSEVADADLESLKTDFGCNASVGQWIVSSGECSQTKIDGPFMNLDDAVNFGNAKFGVVDWITPPIPF